MVLNAFVVLWHICMCVVLNVISNNGWQGLSHGCIRKVVSENRTIFFPQFCVAG